MLVAAGDINQSYEVIGVVHAVVTRTPKKAGCGGVGGLPIQEVYEAVTAALREAASKSGGNGVIHIQYDHRLSSASKGCNDTEAVFEVYGWGTAVKVAP